MFPGVTALENFLSVLFECALKGTFFMLVLGSLTLSARTAAQRHFFWCVGLFGFASLLLADRMILGPALLPNPTWLADIPSNPWVKGIWLTGFGLCMGRIFLGFGALERLRKNSRTMEKRPWRQRLEECRRLVGVQRPVRLLEASGRIMPMTWGLLRSFIVLPASANQWSHERARVVLLHELAHIRRWDFLTRLLRDIIHAIFWFHPVIWWIGSEMDDDREEASDDLVLETGECASGYAHHLATIATGGLLPSRPAVAFARKPLLHRVRQILVPWKPRHPLSKRECWHALTVLLLLLALTAFVDFRPLEKMASQQATAPAAMPAQGIPMARPSPELVEPSSLSQMRSPYFPSANSFEASAKSISQGEVPRVIRPLGEMPQEGDSAIVFIAEPFRRRNPGVGSVLVQGDYSTPPSDGSEAAPRELTREPSREPPPNSDEALAGDIVSFLENVTVPSVGSLGLPDQPTQESGPDLGDLDFAVAKPGEFLVASLLQPYPKRLPEARFSVLLAPLESVPPRVAAQIEATEDPGVISRPLLVFSTAGDRHMAIAFKRKPYAPLASFQVQASSDMREWISEAASFVFVRVVKDDQGRQEVVVAMAKPMGSPSLEGESFMRVRVKKLSS